MCYFNQTKTPCLKRFNTNYCSAFQANPISTPSITFLIRVFAFAYSWTVTRRYNGQIELNTNCFSRFNYPGYKINFLAHLPACLNACFPYHLTAQLLDYLITVRLSAHCPYHPLA